jgi:hypothetical protein
MASLREKYNNADVDAVTTISSPRTDDRSRTSCNQLQDNNIICETTALLTAASATTTASLSNSISDSSVVSRSNSYSSGSSISGSVGHMGGKVGVAGREGKGNVTSTPINHAPVFGPADSTAESDVVSVSRQLQEIWRTVQLKAVWRPMAFVYLYNLFQVRSCLKLSSSVVIIFNF